MTRIYYTGEETAARVGLSWARFRKVRHSWTAKRDFPAEINEPNEAVRYLAEAVDRWLERRSRRVTAPLPEPVKDKPLPPSNDNGAGRRGRQALHAIIGGV